MTRLKEEYPAIVGCSFLRIVEETFTDIYFNYERINKSLCRMHGDFVKIVMNDVYGVTYKNEEKQRKCSNNQWCTTMDNKKYGGVKKKYLTPLTFSCIIAKVSVRIMEKLVEQGLLYDFYGELLTEHQREIYEDAVYQDMSLSEIAEEHGISRQGVHDLIKRCDKLLLGYEGKLHLVERFSRIKEKIEQIECQTTQSEVKELASKILEEL